MAWSLRLVEHRLETGALRSFAKGPRVLFVRAGTIRLVSPGHAEGAAPVGQDAAVFSAGACGVQSYRNALNFLAFELVRQPSPPAGGRVLLEHPIALDPKGAWLMRCDRVDFAPGGVAPRAIQETSSRAVVASTATPCTNTLQPTPAEDSYSSISNATLDPGA